MKRGFVYLAAVIDGATRRVLSWRLSITMTVDFCIEAVEEAIARYGTPEIFNTDQGTPFTGSDFIGLLIEHGILISMDGNGCWRDNVFVERFWKMVKYEEVSPCMPTTLWPTLGRLWRVTSSSTTPAGRIRRLTVSTRYRALQFTAATIGSITAEIRLLLSNFCPSNRGLRIPQIVTARPD